MADRQRSESITRTIYINRKSFATRPALAYSSLIHKQLDSDLHIMIYLVCDYNSMCMKKIHYPTPVWHIEKWIYNDHPSSAKESQFPHFFWKKWSLILEHDCTLHAVAVLQNFLFSMSPFPLCLKSLSLTTLVSLYTDANWWYIPETRFDRVTSELWAPRASPAPLRLCLFLLRFTSSLTTCFCKTGKLEMLPVVGFDPTTFRL